MVIFKQMREALRQPELTHQESAPQPTDSNASRAFTWRKLRGGALLVIGYLLSPVCWWNDLIFNLPIAYLFGYLFSLLSPALLLPFSIVGYWLSNIAGILLMQAGVLDVFQEQPKERNLKKELLTGVATSTVYTLLIVALVQFNVLELPNLFSEEGAVNFSSLLPSFKLKS